MDLRSNLRSKRSRSRTPAQLASTCVEEEVIAENYQHTISRSKKRPTSIINNGSNIVDSHTDEYDSLKRITRSTKIFKTSDYSSEEGEDEVTSTRNVNEFARNRILEDAQKLREDSSEITALGLYRKAKRYWDEYPKTDWTYSPFSKDRVEITPGVVAMPNMSRRHVSSYNKYTETSTSSLVRPKMLFGYRDESKNGIFILDMVKKCITSPLISILAIFYFCLRSVVFILDCAHMLAFELAKQIYRVSCRVMLMDTWLLRRRSPERKTKLLIALCLMPLILLAGWSTTSSMGDTAIIFDSSSLESVSVGKNQFDAQRSNDQLDLITEYRKSNYIAQDKIVEESKLDIIESYTDKKSTEFREHSELQEKLRKQQKHIEELTVKLNEVISELNIHQSRKIPDEEIILQMQKTNVDHISRTLISFLNDPDFLSKQEGLKNWLRSSFIAEAVLEEKFANFTENFNIKFEKLFKSNNEFFMNQITLKLKSEWMQKFESVHLSQNQQTGEFILPEQRIKQIVNDILKIYDADKTGLVDYAMEPMGGQVITTRCTESFSGSAVISILGLPLWYPTSSPRTVITPGINPGKCWAFQNFPGLLVIKLMAPIKIEAFSVEHISKLLVPEGKIDSAPRDFEVFGLRDEEDKNGFKLGQYKYDHNGDSLQFFKTEISDMIFEYIELKITSNHGNPNYTCLYRFRVHGKIQS